MGTSISLNSTSYTIPATGEGGWSDDVSNYLIAAATGFLAKTGGSFTLTADVDFGANYGVKSAYYKSRGTVSSAGIMRLANAESIGWRNAANSADKLLKVNASDQLEYDGNPLHTAALGTAYYVWRMNSGGTASAWALLDNNSIAAGAGIAYSKLTLTGSVVNADIGASAAIAYSKLALTGSVVNADIGAAAAIAYSKLALTGSIVNADIGASAAIAYSKLAMSNSIVNADIASGAAIAYSKLNITSSIVNADVSNSAAIAYSKLSLATSIVNADISASAAIAYSKLNLATSIVNADISASAAIAYSKLNLATSIVNADISASAAIAYSKLNLGTSIVNADISASAAIAYSKLNLATSIVNADINASAAIAYSKLAALTASKALVSDGSGVVSASSVTATELGYVSGVTSAIQTQLTARAPLASANTFTAKQTIQIDDASNNAVTQAAKVSHTTSGTPGVGIGVGVEFEVETSNGNTEIGATIEAVTTAVGAAAEEFDLVVKNMTAGAAADEKVRFKSTGQMRFKNLSSAPSGAQAGDLYYNSTSNKFQAYNGSAWGDIGGSGSGGINYIADVASAMTDASVGAWAQYDEGASATPVDGTGDAGGSGDNQLSAPAVDTTSKLRGANSLKLVKAAANAQGEGYSCAYTSHEIDKNSLQEITFNFDCSNANYTAGDIVVYIYDVTNSTLITPSQTSVPAGKGTFKALFVNGNSNSYRLVLHYAGTNSSAQTLYFDNFMVGPVREGNIGGVPVTEWQSYTPTITIPGTSTAASGHYYRRIGDTCFVRGYFQVSGAGSAGNITVTLPSGLSIDTTKIPDSGLSGFNILGFASTYHVVASNQYDRNVGIIPSGASAIRFLKPLTAAVYAGSDVGASDEFEYEFSFPVASWAGETVSLANSRVEYVWNSENVTAAGGSATNSAYFGYGPQGTSILAYASTTGSDSVTTFDVQFQTPAQVTDRVVVELNDGNGWFDASIRVPPLYQSTSRYGVNLTAVSSTKYRVTFGNKGYASSNATYAGDGGSWSGLTSWKWRVCKSSNPVGIGTGLATSTTPGAYAAGMAPGATNGQAIAAGYVGEVIESSAINSQAAALSSSDVSGASITLSAGVWLIFWSINGYCITGATSGNEVYLVINMTDSSNNVIGNHSKIILAKTVAAVANNVYGVLSNSSVVRVSSSTQYKLRFNRVDNNGTNSAGIARSSGSYDNIFYAVRIA